MKRSVTLISHMWYTFGFCACMFALNILWQNQGRYFVPTSRKMDASLFPLAILDSCDHRFAFPDHKKKKKKKKRLDNIDHQWNVTSFVCLGMFCPTASVAENNTETNTSPLPFIVQRVVFLACNSQKNAEQNNRNQRDNFGASFVSETEFIPRLKKMILSHTLQTTGDAKYITKEMQNTSPT